MSVSLSFLKSQEYDIMQGLVDSEWDESTGENLSLTRLQEQIQAKTEAFISVTTKDGLFDQLISEAKRKIADAEAFIKRQEITKKYIKGIIYDIAFKNPDGYLTFSDGISTQYVKPKMGETRSIKEDALIDPVYKSFAIPKLTNAEHEVIKEALDSLKTNADYLSDTMGFTGTIDDAFNKVREAKESVNVTDLPEDHSAIQTKLTPGYSIVKNKPKAPK